MKIEEIQDVIRVGEITEGTKVYGGNKHVAYDRALSIDYDDSLPKGLVNKYLASVYVFVVDGEVFKIGQTGAKKGLKSAVDFYLKSGQDDPGLNRFAINYFIREVLKQGKRVELYFQYKEPIKISVDGMFGKVYNVETLPSPKILEELWLEDYKYVEGEFPVWNFQEKGEKICSDIQWKFAEYKKLRA